MTKRHIPEGLGEVTAALGVPDCNRALEFYSKVFGATEILRLRDPDGSTAHLEIRIGSSVVMLADENPDWGNLSPETIGGTPVRLHLYVEDVDACAERAVAAGAELSMPVADQFYGDRSGRILDPFGHIWILATHIEEVSQEEMQRRYDEMTSQGD